MTRKERENEKNKEQIGKRKRERERAGGRKRIGERKKEEREKYGYFKDHSSSGNGKV